MTQPELGKHIAQLRSSQGLTQQELADRCRLNIRTIQRIEAGEVVPRMYTLNQLIKPLNMELNELSMAPAETGMLAKQLKNAFTAGAVFLINGLAVVYDLIAHTFSPVLHSITSVVHLVSWALFFAGFYHIGRFYKNRLLYISALIMMLTGVILNALDLLKPYFFSGGMGLIFIIMCLNMLLFGSGLLKESFERKGLENGSLYKFAGIATILIALLYLSLNSKIINAGLILSIPGNLLLLSVLYKEFKDSETEPRAGGA